MLALVLDRRDLPSGQPLSLPVFLTPGPIPKVSRGLAVELVLRMRGIT